jgi:hypothetical protein
MLSKKISRPPRKAERPGSTAGELRGGIRKPEQIADAAL